MSIENGVVTISVDVAAGGNSNGNVRNAVTSKIKETFGNDMTSVADYWMCECVLRSIFVELIFAAQGLLTPSSLLFDLHFRLHPPWHERRLDRLRGESYSIVLPQLLFK